MKNNKPDCYKCKYRGNVPGSAHSCCNHPTVKEMLSKSNNSLLELLSLFQTGAILIQPRDMNIKANQHGLDNGWFNFPFDFDPVWLENCDGFEKDEK